MKASPDREPELELVLFPRRPRDVQDALAAGLESLIIDLEWRGKKRRQEGADTEINRGRPADLEPLVTAGVPRRYCRLDAPGPWTAEQIEATLAAGATHLLLPMVRKVDEATDLLRRVDGRAAAGILVETEEAVALAPELGRLPLERVYVGLNDLAIVRRTRLFQPLVDGTLERLRGCFPDTAFGFGGATVVDGGRPVPCRLLLAEMARLDARFCFLRRSFHRDTRPVKEPSVPWQPVVTELAAEWRRLRVGSFAEVAAHRTALEAAVELGLEVRAVAP